jgi:hypothetical protein
MPKGVAGRRGEFLPEKDEMTARRLLDFDLTSNLLVSPQRNRWTTRLLRANLNYAHQRIPKPSN